MRLSVGPNIEFPAPEATTDVESLYSGLLTSSISLSMVIDGLVICLMVLSAKVLNLLTKPSMGLYAGLRSSIGVVMLLTVVLSPVVFLLFLFFVVFCFFIF